MAALHEIQSAFILDIYSGENKSHPYLARDKGFEKRFCIYRNNTLLGLTDTLGNIYPVIKRIVGDQFFTMMAGNFISIHPQNRGNRNTFGGNLSCFLKQYTPSASLFYLPDVAALEWAYFQSAIADDAPALTFPSLLKTITSNPEYILLLHHSVHLVPQTYNALEVWQAHQNEPFATFALTSDTRTLLIWRDADNMIWMRKLSEALRVLLEQSQDNKPFSEAIRIASHHTDNVESFQKEFAEVMNHNVFMQTRKEPYHAYQKGAISCLNVCAL